MPKSGTSLLIVDDEQSTRTSMTQIFASMGYNVRSAEDGFSALSTMRQELPEVILSDLNMPGMSGFELLSVVRRRFPLIKVIAMSGAFSGDGNQPGVAADAFYEKGKNLANLLSTLQSVVHEMPPGRQASATAPIWVAGNGSASSSGMEFILSCQECLRSFSVAHDDSVTVIKEAGCPHCFNLILYAVVQSSNAAAPQPFQRKPVSVSGPSEYLQSSQASGAGNSVSSTS